MNGLYKQYNRWKKSGGQVIIANNTYGNIPNVTKDDTQETFIQFDDNWKMVVSHSMEYKPMVSLYINEKKPCNNMESFKVKSNVKLRNKASFKLEQTVYHEHCDHYEEDGQIIENLDTRYFNIDHFPPVFEHEYLSQNYVHEGNKMTSFYNLLMEKTDGQFYDENNKYSKKVNDAAKEDLTMLHDAPGDVWKFGDAAKFKFTKENDIHFYAEPKIKIPL